MPLQTKKKKTSIQVQTKAQLTKHCKKFVERQQVMGRVYYVQKAVSNEGKKLRTSK